MFFSIYIYIYIYIYISSQTQKSESYIDTNSLTFSQSWETTDSLKKY